MKLIAQTTRLLLRELTPDDAQDFFWLNEDPEVIRYTGDSSFGSVEKAKDFLENYQAYQLTGMGRWAVISRETETFLGWCGLKLEDGICDLGFRFHKRYWNRGFATEAALASLELGFNTLGQQEIIGRALRENTASIRVLEKVGMVFSHEFPAHGDVGKWFVLDKADWMKNLQNIR